MESAKGSNEVRFPAIHSNKIGVFDHVFGVFSMMSVANDFTHIME